MQASLFSERACTNVHSTSQKGQQLAKCIDNLLKEGPQNLNSKRFQSSLVRFLVFGKQHQQREAQPSSREKNNDNTAPAPCFIPLNLSDEQDDKQKSGSRKRKREVIAEAQRSLSKGTKDDSCEDCCLSSLVQLKPNLAQLWDAGDIHVLPLETQACLPPPWAQQGRLYWPLCVSLLLPFNTAEGHLMCFNL